MKRNIIMLVVGFAAKAFGKGIKDAFSSDSDSKKD